MNTPTTILPISSQGAPGADLIAVQMPQSTGLETGEDNITGQIRGARYIAANITNGFCIYDYTKAPMKFAFNSGGHLANDLLRSTLRESLL